MIPPHINPPIFDAAFYTKGVYGLNQLLLGTSDKEFSIDITPDPLFDYLSKDIVWEVDKPHLGVEVLPDKQGRHHVARVRFTQPTWETITLKARISYDLNPGMDERMRVLTQQEMERTIKLNVAEPGFQESAFILNKSEPLLVFAGDRHEFDSRIWMPLGYSTEAKWSVSKAVGPDKSPANVARIVKEGAESCTVEMLTPGEFTLTLTSVPYDFISDWFTLKVINKEQGGSVNPTPTDDDGTQPNPIPDNPDPGGDDSVDTDAGGGGTKPGDDSGGGGGDSGGGGKRPVYEEWEESELNAPKLLRITVDGSAPASADVAAMRAATLRFEFDSPIDRYSLSAILSDDLSVKQGEDYAVVSGFALSGDGKTLTVSFLPKYEGLFVLYYSFEGKTGLSVRGGFGLYAEKASSTVPATPVQPGGSGKGGGGCGVTALPFLLFLLCAVGAVGIARRGKRALRMLLLLTFLGLASTANATTYVVTNAGDELDFPPAGSLRSILHTIDLLGTKHDVIQFAQNIETIELKGTLECANSTTLDGYTGRRGKRVTLTLASGGYWHAVNGKPIEGKYIEIEFMSDFSANGIVFKGFGKGDPRNIPGAVNGGLFCFGGYSYGTKLQNCSFVDIVGARSPVMINFSGRGYLVEYDTATMDMCLFRGNVSENSGGAIQVLNGSVALQDTFVAYNWAKERGGAFYNQEEGPDAGGQSPFADNASLHNTIVNNSIGAVPPKGRSLGNSMSMEASTGAKIISRVSRGNSPGVFPGLLTLSRCTIIENEAQQSGGAIVSTGLLLCNSLIAGNSAGVGAPAITGVLPDFRASLFANNDTGVANPTPDRYEYDDKGNLYANGVTEAVLRRIFEKYPIAEEDRGGYIPVVPIKYAGPAEGMVFAELRNAIDSSHPLAFDADVRGVPRRYAEGASIGSYEFGRVTIEPGNVQNSTTIGLKPNDKGSIKVKLIERITVGGLSATNYLGEIPMTFALKDGDNLEALPHDTETADNGRAFAAVSTLGAGTSVVRAALTDRPARYLDLQVKVGGDQSSGGGSSWQEDDDLYVVTLDPSRTAPGVENTYWATFSRTCASSTVSIRRKGTTDYIKRDIPVDMLPSVYGKLRGAIAFEKSGSYMFDFAMTDGSGRQYTDTKEVRVEASSLKVFRMSEPPYYEDKTLSMLASFSVAPKEISMTLTDENGAAYKPELYSKNERLGWEGFVTSGKTGYYTATLEYTDGGDGKGHKEHFTIYIAPYYGTGSTVVSGGKGGGGCSSGAFGLLSALLSGAWVLRARKPR